MSEELPSKEAGEIILGFLKGGEEATGEQILERAKQAAHKIDALCHQRIAITMLMSAKAIDVTSRELAQQSGPEAFYAYQNVVAMIVDKYSGMVK